MTPLTPFDDRLCTLGEGPLWHPERRALFWFDILEKRMFMRQGDHRRVWRFDEHVSAAGWVDDTTLLIASETALWRFDIDSGAKSLLEPLEAENAVTRSNDGRADPWGGFWIGTMGKNAEAKAGAIYRFAGGVLRQIVCDITISNAICFAPDKTCAYYTDTATQKVMRQPLNPKDGWADGAAEVFLDLHAARLNPDGAVTDAQGNLWIAMWGASAVVCFDPQGRERDRINVPARQPSCPAFGGQTLCDLYVTTAHYGVWEKERAERPHNGATFVIPNVAQGVAEPRVIL